MFSIPADTGEIIGAGVPDWDPGDPANSYCAKTGVSVLKVTELRVL